MSDRRDYSLLGRDGAAALKSGLASARWYQTEIPRKSLAALMKPADGPAIRDTIILFVAMAGLASAAAMLYPSWAVGAVFPRLWRALWLGDGFPMA